ncbi:Toll/interleukin-1 receptor domain-containing protein, partial [Tanacetum coccineum]
GTEATQCITGLYAYGLNVEMLMNGLANMKELRFLHVDTLNVREDEVSNWNLPNALRFLRFFQVYPKHFNQIILLDFKCISARWINFGKMEKKRLLKKLRFLKFTESWKLRTLDLGVAPNLETLILKDCDGVVEVHFQVTPNLKDLRISDCKRLEKLHMTAQSPKLVYLGLCKLKKLRTLHLGITPNLEILYLSNCSDMVELHMPAQCPKLVDLNLSNLKLMTLHLGITPNLETLYLSNCADMVELHMPAQCPKLVALNLTECPKLVDLDLTNFLKLMTLHLGITPNLETLRVVKCYSYNLVELQIHSECPKLVNLDLRHCTKVMELPAEIGRLECLKELDITGTGIRHLPESIFRVKGLRIFGVRWKLKSLGFTSMTQIVSSNYAKWYTVVE